MPEMPKTFAITRIEGGHWEPFVKHASPSPDREGSKVHAIMFEDGSVWDAFNGWRTGMLVTPEQLRAAWAGEARRVA
jgi:hypothetical protein